MKTMYEMELNETIETKSIGADRTNITRVPGGWIYHFMEYYEQSISNTCCFVPYSEEFK